jgi:hypothetical protein
MNFILNHKYSHYGADDPQTRRADLGRLAQGKPDCENCRAEIEDGGIQDPHA